MLSVLHVQVMYDQVLEHTDAGVATEDAVVTFDSLAVLIPRGRFDVELYPSFMKLLGQVRSCMKLPELRRLPSLLATHVCSWLWDMHSNIRILTTAARLHGY